MAEALACGTPVIGLARGALPEIVRDGKTGFVCGDEDELVAGVDRVAELDRAACRADCEARFSDEVIAQSYVSVYREMIERGAAGG